MLCCSLTGNHPENAPGMCLECSFIGRDSLTTTVSTIPRGALLAADRVSSLMCPEASYWGKEGGREGMEEKRRGTESEQCMISKWQALAGPGGWSATARQTRAGVAHAQHSKAQRSVASPPSA